MFNVKFETVEPITDFDRHLYQFDLMERTNQMVVRLYYYARESRPSTRHKWRPIKHWELIDQRSNTCERPVVPEKLYRQACESFALFIRPETDA